MAFDNKTFKRVGSLGDGGMVFHRNGANIKKTSAVVELQFPRGRQLRQREIDLRAELRRAAPKRSTCSARDRTSRSARGTRDWSEKL